MRSPGIGRRIPKGPRSGSALIVVLGVIAVLTILVFAYSFAARVERIAARSVSDSSIAEEHIDSIVAAIMSTEVPMRLLGIYSTGGSLAPFSGRVDFSSLAPVMGDHTNHFSRYAFTSLASVYGYKPYGTCESFLNNASTNFMPSALHDMITSLDADWLNIETVADGDYDGDRPTIYTNTLYAFAVVDLSGFLDATTMTSNEVAYLKSVGDIMSASDFLEDRARALAPSDPALSGYASYRDMALRNRGLAEPSGHILHFSYDPAPDVTITNGEVYADLLSDNFDAILTPKLDLNAWTNGFSGDLSSPADLEEHYHTDAFREWFADVTNRLSFCGLAEPESIAWNLVNFLDGDRIPQGPGPAPWRDDWPQEDVPLINEIAVAQVPYSFGVTNHYATAIELWYPFSPRSITPDDDAQLVVAVYTNWPAFASSHSNSTYHAHASWTNDIVLLPSGSPYGFTVTNAIERMEFGTSTEFAVFASQPSQYVSFPVTITDFVRSGEEVDKVRKETDGTWRHDASGTNILYRHVEHLPIGIQKYHSYARTDDGEDDGHAVWERREMTVTNEIRLLVRVRLGERWVDEAMAYDPDPDSPYHVAPYRYTAPCGWQVNDPRRNGFRHDWKPYDGVEFTADGDALCTLSGTTNTLCKPFGRYGQGLPIVHYDGPARRAGDIGYIYQPYSFSDDVSDYGYLSALDVSDASGLRISTNAWQSICLCDDRAYASHGNFTYSPGSVMEFFTARCATNRSVRGLVSAWTWHQDVIGALLADMEIGSGLRSGRLNDSAIEWMKTVYTNVQEKMYDEDSRPIGVGDICMAFGGVDDYRDIPGEYLDSYEPWNWDGSLGNDSKEDIVRELCERLSFRQQIFAIVVDARVMSPAMTLRAERRAVVIVVRDAYTGAWRIVERHFL